MAILQFNTLFRTEAMDEAAKNGHLDVLVWLHENRQEGCTGGAMDMASRHGHLEVLKFLHENRSEGCSTLAVDFAAHNGHTEVKLSVFGQYKGASRTTAIGSRRCADVEGAYGRQHRYDSAADRCRMEMTAKVIRQGTYTGDDG
ncbi:unnamed protein product [Ectocarpus sp. CCAP 1310/34]|nr:unnamed protein product [Ectocarpus sp. CCAP 1310/34]